MKDIKKVKDWGERTGEWIMAHADRQIIVERIDKMQRNFNKMLEKKIELSTKLNNISESLLNDPNKFIKESATNIEKYIDNVIGELNKAIKLSKESVELKCDELMKEHDNIKTNIKDFD